MQNELARRLRATSRRYVAVASIALGLSMAAITNANAAGWTAPLYIPSLLVIGDGTALATLETTATNVNACAGTFDYNFKLVTTAGDIGKALLSQLQLAFAMHKKVTIFSGGCSGNYNTVDAVSVVY